MSDAEKQEIDAGLLAKHKALKADAERLRIKLVEHAVGFDGAAKYLNYVSANGQPPGPAFSIPDEPDWTAFPATEQVKALVDDFRQCRAQLAAVREQLRVIGDL